MNVITCVFTENLENYLGPIIPWKESLAISFHSISTLYLGGGGGGGAKGESKIAIFDLIVRVKQSASFLFYSAQFST